MNFALPTRYTTEQSSRFWGALIGIRVARYATSFGYAVRRLGLLWWQIGQPAELFVVRRNP
jgi:hypothetical protein